MNPERDGLAAGDAADRSWAAAAIQKLGARNGAEAAGIAQQKGWL